MAKEDIIFAGGGSKSPSLMMWSNPDNETKPLIISQFPDKYSVYALAISPNGTRIAAGTKAGLLRIYKLTDFKASENAPVLFEIFHLPAVTSLAFCTDDILVSGGLDGNIKAWSIPEKQQLAEFSAHSDGVFALRQIGSLVLASIGGDSVLRIWDMDSVEKKYESDSFVLPRIRALTSLDYNSDTGLLVHPSRSGDLHAYDARNDFKKHIISAHEGDFCALAYGNDYMFTAGSQDAVIKIWSTSLDNLITKISAPAGVLAVGWAGSKKIMTVFTDGSGQFWNVNNGDLLPGERFDGSDLRVAAGLPTELISRFQTVSIRQWRDKKLAEAEELIEQPEKQKELDAIVDELSQRGFSAEAALVLADIAKRQGKLLWELESRLALVEDLGDGETALPSLYALGELLQTIKEPKLAQHYLKKILRIDENYLDVNERIEQLNSDPFLQLCPDKDVRGDLMQKELVLQELEKHTILKKKFSWRTILAVGQTISFGVNVKVQDVTNSLSEAIVKSGDNIPLADLSQVKLFHRGQLKDIVWVYVPSALKELGVAFAMEICSGDVETEFTPYDIFDPALLGISATVSPQEHNQRIEEMCLKLLKSSKAKKWLAKTNKLAMKNIRQFIKKFLAQQDNDY